MGWFARGIVFVLFLMSAYGTSVAIRKSLQLTRATRASRRLAPQLASALASGDFAAAQQAVQSHPESHLAQLMTGIFPNLSGPRPFRGSVAADVSDVERTVEINLLTQVAAFRRGLGSLATIAATAPFVGLLGTVMGIVNAFTAIASSGSSGLAGISAGIAEALITTALGLLVAIPAVWVYNYFVNRIEFLAIEMTCAGKQVSDALLRHEAEASVERAESRGYGAAAS
jgi:biopolymer transport protein ExbB/biopolymer transport protein TolQ